MKRQILVVDEYEVNRKILAEILEEEYEVLTANTGADALQLLHICGSRVSAVLIALNLPVMDGFEFIKNVRMESRFAQLPIIVITQDDGSDIEEKAFLAGAADYVERPFKPAVILQRLSNIIRMHEAIENLRDAEKDSLTGLYNKKAFYRMVQDRLEHVNEGEYVIAVLDIEKFKILNDTFGWEAGDHLLMVTAQILKSRFMDSDVLIGYGDRDIFMLFMRREEITEEEFLSFEKEVEDRFGKSKVNFKVGVYIIEDKKRKVRSMCDYAVLAVNNIKGQFEKKYCVFESSFLEGLLLEKRITDGMQDSLDNQNFQVYIQPKYDIGCNLMIGAEALVRWNHPQLGAISPADFIPIFEKNGSITRLDWYVWEKVCQYLAEWKEKYNRIVPVSVNVSREDINMDNFPEKMYNLVTKYGLEPACLHLEITETAYTENTSELISVLRRLKEYGFIIEMDDFGSGYSSLNLLADLPVDIIKLDIKFIQNEIQNKTSTSIMKFIINMARWMNLLVIAEGVETKKQLDYLKQLNCNFVQGYFYATPMRAEEFERRLISEELLPIFDMKSYLNHLVSQKRVDDSDSEEILVVDDLEMNRAILVDYLKDRYKMVEAENGLVALEYIKVNYENIAAIISDIYMPVMDGFELLSMVKNTEEFKHICFVVISSDEEIMRENKKLEAADDFILKPYEKEEIIQRITAVLEKQNRQELRQLRRTENMAKRDRMTMLYNRDEFERQVKEYLETNEECSATFLLIEVDHVRSINDTYGHVFGDNVIKAVAAKLENRFRANDVVCRFGGAKFAVFLKVGFEEEDLKKRMQKLCDDFNFILRDNKINITCSIGICRCPEFGNQFDSLFRHADMALLAAKRLGKNRYISYGSDFNITAADKKAHPKLLQFFHKSSE